MDAESKVEEAERMEKLTIEKEDGRLLTYYRFAPLEASKERACPN